VGREALSPEILRAMAGAIDFEGMFRELDALVPPGVLFESVRLDPASESSAGLAAGTRVLRVEGLAAGGPEAAERSLARLLAGVEQSDAFTNVQRVRSDEAGRRGESILKFAFTCEIEEGSAPHDRARAAEDP
jgi:Tfp pilus assembly protein PilN